MKLFPDIKWSSLKQDKNHEEYIKRLPCIKYYVLPNVYCICLEKKMYVSFIIKF